MRSPPQPDTRWSAARIRPRPVVDLRRSDVYPDPNADGRPLSEAPGARLRRWLERALTSRGEREEAELTARLASCTRPTRVNTIAHLSPKGGVGKTTCTFLSGSTLSAYRHLRVVAIDANRDHGTLASLAPDRARSPHSLADLLGDVDRVRSAPEIVRYVSELPSGLHILAAPEHPEVMAEMTPELYGQVHAFLSRYYDLIVLDLGTGIVDPLAQWAIQRADQAVVVTDHDLVTTQKVLASLRHLHDDGGFEPGDGRVSVVVNRVPGEGAEELGAIQSAFAHAGVRRQLVIHEQEQLRQMLNRGNYALESLPRSLRLPIKRLALTVGEGLV